MISLCQNFTSQHIKFYNAFNFIVKHLDAHSLFTISGWNNFDNITAYPESTTLKIYIITVILYFYQFMQYLLTVNNLTKAQRQYHIIIFLRRTQTVDTGYTGHNNYIPAFKQSTSGRVAQLINLVVNRSILFNISIGLRNIRFRLIIVIIRNKIFYSIFRKECL